MSSRHLIIHGHFYQPPRENPWILGIEPQISAAPFENWNFRINRECYAPNGRARLMTDAGRIKSLLNNYEHLSFNFGPTLLSWMEKAAPETLEAIVRADHRAAEAKDGHGPALAQIYNHIIMPLADTRDRLTQIRWGLADFERHFSRRPEGMWLAEAAVDLETLKMLAREGLKFTILSQGQAEAVRPLESRAVVATEVGDGGWVDVSGGRIDPREPYRVFWGGGPDDFLDVFFYDGPVSRAIAFEKLLSDGAALLHRVEEAFGEPRPDGGSRLVNLATDGESYGHHFTFGEMALAWLFDRLLKTAGDQEAIKLTNYGHFLALYPPTKEVRIFDNSSWSCVHGVERWRADCGCNTGGGDGTWNQKWRGPLRDGLNWLRDRLAETFQKTGGRYLADPWLARDKYITLVANGYAPEIQEKFLAAHCLAPLDRKERLEVLSLLEAQLMSLYMFTSCGWFFDDISGLEPVQNLRYALRAIELSQGLTETNLREGFLGYLDLIRPNDPEYETGRDIWRRKVENGSLTGRALAAHWAAATLLDVPQLLDSFAEPTFQNRGVTILEGEDLNILAGVVDLVDRRLGRTTSHLCLALHSGGTHLAIMAGDLDAEAEIPAWLNRDALREALAHQPLTASASMIIWDRLVKLADMENASRHIMSDLLPHCRNMLLSTLLNDVFDDLKERAEDIFHTHQHLLMMNRLSGRPLDWEEDFIFRAVGEAELRYVMEPARFSRPLNLGALTYLLNKRGLLSLVKTTTSLEEIGRAFLDTTFRALATAESPRRLLTELIEFLRIIDREGFSLDRWESQNRWCDLTGDKDFQARLSPEEEKLMDELGLALGFAPPPTGGPAD